jgi:hypothetical protein
MAPPLTVTNEFVRIDYASDAPAVGGGIALRFIGAHDAAAALNDYVIFTARDLWGKGNFKLDGRADLERSVGTNVNASGAEIAGHTAGVASGIFPMNLDRQMERKPFSGTRFSHNSSSAVALEIEKTTKLGNGKLKSVTSSYGRYITENSAKEAQITFVIWVGTRYLEGENWP